MAKQTHLQAILSAVDKISPVLRGVNGTVAKTKMGLGSMNMVNFGAAQRKLGMFGKAFRDVGNSSRGVLGGLGLPTSIALGALGFGFAAAAKRALDYAGALTDASENTGLAVGPMQEMQSVFKAGGVSAEDFTSAVTKLNKGMADAAAGKDKGLAGLFTQLRIPLRDAKGQIRGVEEVMGDLSSAFEKNTNPAVRTRMAMELFGKAGAKLISVMAQGGKSFAQARAEMQRLGLVLADVATKRLDDLGDALGMLGQQVQVQLAGAFAVAAPAVEGATKSLMEWIAGNKEMLQQKLGAVIERMANAFKAWVDSGGIERLMTGIQGIVEGVGDFIEAMGGVKNVLMGIGVLILAGPVASLFSLGAAFARLALMAAGPLLTLTGIIVKLGLAMLANPVFLAITLIAVAAYMIYKNWEPISQFFVELWETVTSVFTEKWEAIKAVVTSGLALIEGLLASWSPLALIKAAWGPVLSFLGTVWEAASKVIGAVGGVSAPGAAGGAAVGSATPLSRAGALQAPTSRVQGDMKVRFENAPPGMRVEQGAVSPGLTQSVDVGYRRMGAIG